MLTLHLPLTDRTYQLVDHAFLAGTVPGAILVNCGRGGLVDLDAAVRALESGQLAGVGLDATAATFADAARGIVDVLAGKQPAAVANPAWAGARTEDK